MIKDAMDRLLALAPPNYKDILGLTYVDKPLTLVKPPEPPAIEVGTLTGLVDLLKERVDELVPEQCFIHVEHFGQVTVSKKDSDDYARRQVFIQARLEDVERFPFGRFLDSETFAIWMQAGFVPGQGDVDEITRIASNLTADSILNAEDDGIRQRVTIKQGVQLKDGVTVKRRMTVTPFRTFREVDQPASDVVFRVRQEAEGKIPVCALFEADGGKWKLDAMQNIKTWLKGQDLGSSITIVA